MKLTERAPNLIKNRQGSSFGVTELQLNFTQNWQKYGQVRIRTEDLPHAKGARYQLRHMPLLELGILS